MRHVQTGFFLPATWTVVRWLTSSSSPVILLESLRYRGRQSFQWSFPNKFYSKSRTCGMGFTIFNFYLSSVEQSEIHLIIQNWLVITEWVDRYELKNICRIFSQAILVVIVCIYAIHCVNFLVQFYTLFWYTIVTVVLKFIIQ